MSLGLLVALALTASAPAPCVGSAVESQALVRRFYTTALVERRVREGFERDVSSAFVEHKPDIASADRVGAIAFLEGLIAELPEARWELLRVTGDAELVAVHASFTPAPGAPTFAIADFFRIDRCEIVEHWDVVAGPPKESPNPLPRF